MRKTLKINFDLITNKCENIIFVSCEFKVVLDNKATEKNIENISNHVKQIFISNEEMKVENLIITIEK